MTKSKIKFMNNSYHDLRFGDGWIAPGKSIEVTPRYATMYRNSSGWKEVTLKPNGKSKAEPLAKPKKKAEGSK